MRGILEQNLAHFPNKRMDQFLFMQIDYFKKLLIDIGEVSINLESGTLLEKWLFIKSKVIDRLKSEKSKLSFMDN